jgi:hypothetical protein
MLPIENPSVLVGFILLHLVRFMQIDHIPGHFPIYFFGAPSNGIPEDVNFSLVMWLQHLLCFIELL